MSAFEKASDIERRSFAVVRPFIQQRAYNGQYVVTAKGPLARDLQKTVGDFLYNADSETVYGIELKAEEENKYGRLFLETWSNRKWFTLGWMYTLQTDILLYHFLNDDLLYRIPFRKLRTWAFHEGRIYEYKERPQSKYAQKNDTWGRCVPIDVLHKEIDLPEPYKPVKAAFDGIVA